MAYYGRNSLFFRVIPVIAGMMAGFFAFSAEAADLGSTVSNLATVSHGSPGGQISVTTAPASFTIEAQRTPSTVEFFRYAPNAPDAISVALNGSDFSTDNGVNFSAIGTVAIANGAPLDFSLPVSLTPAQNYFTGEPVFVSVTDIGQNGNASAIETITVRIVSDTGDEIFLRLYETGPDTGVFFGYFDSTGASTAPLDAVLSVARGATITATYIDPFDANEVSVDVAGVDPFGRVFDSLTGALIDGAVVTIIDNTTGQPAQVFGIDGVSTFPSTITTGASVTDSAGMVYNLQPGEFVFPIMFPGDFRLEIIPPAGYAAPSVTTQADIDALPGAPFIIAPASFLNVFALTGTGDVSFDVPIDPDTELVVSKSASSDVASIGDFIRYTIRIENRGSGAAPLNVRDILPKGFRYQSGSARLDGAALVDPLIAPDGETLTFAGGLLAGGASVEIAYVAEVGAGAKNGDAVNRAFVASAAGGALSNTGQASVFIREDLLRSNLTIVGRVLADGCSQTAPWPRKIEGGEGVGRVRLYLETGAYATTDEDGLFHFADVDAKRHVIQLDEASLPQGYEPVICEENTRFAGSAISQFVDAQGGSVWRANFYLQKTEAAIESEADATSSPDNLDYKQFDNAWLDQAGFKTEFVYPADGATPSARSVHIGIKHPNFTSVTLLINGSKAPGLNFAGRDVNNSKTMAFSRWRGVDLVDGDNHFTAIVLDQAGNEVARLERTVSFVSEVARVEYVAEKSRLAADGRQAPAIAVRVTDGAGRPVHRGRIIPVKIDPPYRAKDLHRLEDALPLTAPQSTTTQTIVGDDGIALIELEPTLQTGAARIAVILDNQQEEEITAYLTPELRDWIVVGLAEGGLAYQREKPEGAPSARNLLRDGRIAAFAKGTVKGDWLVTAAVDTDKGDKDRDGDIFDDIDPDARYAVFGDRSEQGFEAQSRYPFYLKAEKGGFQAQWGDYDTGLNETRLGKYTRKLSGAQAVYEGEHFRFRGFAAETSQQFVRDEIAADGTSGPFRVSAAPLVRNSETLIVETRNRFRPDEVVSITSLIRYIDYDLDFETGEFILRLPVPAAVDEDGYNVLVAEYETRAAAEKNLVAGGRGAVKFANGRVEAGVTVIHEEGRPDAVDAASDLASVDLRADITETTRLRLEYGASRRAAGGASPVDEDGNAILAEVDHVSSRLNARAYYQEADSGFGLGQQSSGISGVRRYGGEARFVIGEFNAKRSGARGERYLEASAYKEENLTTGANRLVAELKLAHAGALTGAAAGIRRIVEETADGVKRRATLITTEARQRFEKLGLTLKASHDQPIGSDQSILFPERTTFGFEQTLFDNLRLEVSHEISKGDNVRSSNTIVGVSAEPWSGARLTASADKITQESGRRLGATFGVDQQVQIDEHWSASMGLSRREQLASDGTISEIDDIVPDQPRSPLESNENYTSIFFGAGYRDENMQGSARFEMRKSADATRYTGVLAAVRDVSEVISLAAAARIEETDNRTDPDERRADIRIGLAVRPRNEGLIIFDRFDLRQHIVDGQETSWKAINNLGLNARLTDRWQISVNHGIKYSFLDAANDSYSGYTQLIGFESRLDISDRVDIGAHLSALYSHNSGTLDYSFGPSIGVSPAKNIWISAGYNFEGFSDDDFSFAGYTRNGPFVRLRVKFDQNTAQGLLSAINPAE